jgi:DNA-binding transcriptional ArsR family regulator
MSMTTRIPTPAPATDLDTMAQHAKQAADYLKTLAHPSRLLLLCFLAEKERSVTELEQLLSLRQPTVSQQLARLRDEGLVATRREGKTVFYALSDDTTKLFIALIYDRFCKGI